MPGIGKTVLITGASGGLGSVVTRAFVEAGHRVAGISRERMEFRHPGFAAFPAEIDSRAGAEAAVSAVRERMGRIDALVHLIGAFAGGTPLTETSDAVLDRMLNANLWPFFHMARALLPAMQEQGHGTILAIGSRAAVEPQAGLSAYAASKAALVSLVQTVAQEGRAFGVSANAVLPGTMDTPANRAAMPTADPGAWVRPEQVAALLLHLVSNEASQISGAVIPIYGGQP